MPCITNCAVVGHLYAKPELKSNDKGPYCQIRFWTKDKVKGQEEAAFTSWSAFVHGKQAEWLAEGEKGNPVWVSGSIRLDTFRKQDGTESHTIMFTRVAEARLTENNKDAGAPVPSQKAAKPDNDTDGVPF